MRCWLSQFSEDPCVDDWHLDPAHLIAKQNLKRAGWENLWDTRLYVPACRWHHTRFDDGRLRVPRCALPEGLEAFAEGLGLGGYLDRRYGTKEAIRT